MERGGCRHRDSRGNCCRHQGTHGHHQGTHEHRQERDNGPQNQEGLHISEPHFGRLKRSPAVPDGLTDVNSTLNLAAPRWDDHGQNPLLHVYDGVCGGPSGNEHEGRVLNFLDIFDISERDLGKLTALHLPDGFSRIKFPTIAKYLNIKRVEDIQYLPIFRSRVSIGLFDKIQNSLLNRTHKYGIKLCPWAINDPSFRNVLVAELLYEVTSLFPIVEFCPGSILGGGVGYPSARVKEAFFNCLGVKALCYVAVDPKAEKKNDSSGAARLLAELAVCNYRNIQAGRWVPMLGILSDGYQFQFWVYDSNTKKIWASHWIPGFNGKMQDDMEGFLISLKIAVEHLYDFFSLTIFNIIRIRVRELHRLMAINPTNQDLIAEEHVTILALNQYGEAQVKARRADWFRSIDRLNRAESEACDAARLMEKSLKHWSGVMKTELPVHQKWDSDAVLKG
ncbi:hypothetical protein TWF506_005792 [Arthrobotrys conoides]|uniref:Uncharacterized protein n=1 Tax=Arthrobotrys conoides TaxID=74498 RepID=A0AAN8NUS8_9PEZI